MSEFWIILTGCLVAVSCSLLGCFLILRKMAMVGDAISHAVLPGIVIAYLLTGSRDSLYMLIGATIFGMTAAFLIEFFHKKAKLQEDASIGITFTWLFAIGVILVSKYTADVDLDQDCVLYGEIINVPYDVLITESNLNLGPKSIWISSFVLLFIIGTIIITYKELLITTFDPGYASAIGLSVSLWHYVLMGMVSMATVSSFNAVGAILVVAFLVAPAATAYLLTDNFKWMLVLSSLSGILSAIGGYYLASWLDASVSGSMAANAGVLFALACLFSPSNGLLIKKFTPNLNADFKQKKELIQKKQS